MTFLYPDLGMRTLKERDQQAVNGVDSCVA